MSNQCQINVKSNVKSKCRKNTAFLSSQIEIARGVVVGGTVAQTQRRLSAYAKQSERRRNADAKQTQSRRSADATPLTPQRNADEPHSPQP